ncbi:10753_t:CDS:2 [Ambispora leptoticha]|uniref:10753_t:CDS:1 n=1 Tax=Ambispora leptoticha TaxID=144679 RepID=A0A9N8VR55_9GLOM|nr:10753_t:CDS:2 [Ambispora leptoticha]
MTNFSTKQRRITIINRSSTNYFVFFLFTLIIVTIIPSPINAQNCSTTVDCQPGQECLGRQCLWTCYDSTDCPDTDGICSNGICKATEVNVNLPSGSPAVQYDNSYEIILIVIIALVVSGGGIFGLWWYRRRRLRIHRFHTIVSAVNTPRNSMIVTSESSTRQMEERQAEERSEHLEVRSSRDITREIRSLEVEEVAHVVQQTHQTHVGSSDIVHGAGVSSIISGVAGGSSGGLEGNTEVEETPSVHETTIYGDTGASTSSIDLSAEAINPHHHHEEPYQGDD